MDIFVIGWECGCPFITLRDYDAGDVLDYQAICPEHGAPQNLCLSSSEIKAKYPHLFKHENNRQNQKP